MNNVDPLRTMEDYKRALKEIGVYFDNQPEPGTEAGKRFELLAVLIKEYEDAHYSILEGRSAMVEDNIQEGRDDLISRFEEGLLLASDKQYILDMLRSSARAVSSLEAVSKLGMLENPEATSVCAELYQVIGYLADELGVFAHPDVQCALDNASQHKLVHRDLLPWPKQPLRPARHPIDRSSAGSNSERARAKIEAVPTQAECASQFEQTNVAIIDWKMEAERANRLLALAEAQVEAWRERASQKDAELTVLRDQIARRT